MNVKVPYGLKDGRTVHINEVKEKGFACDCVCPGCGMRLMARFYKNRTDHFAHEKGEGHKDCLESALHHAAKDILLKRREIMLPAVEVNFAGSAPPYLLANPRSIQMDDVILEKREGTIVPDVIGIIKDVRLLIEIYVTHRVDDEKRVKIKEMGISAIEVDLSDHDRKFERESLESTICDSSDKKWWVFNRKVEDYREKMHRFCKKMMVKRSGWDGRAIVDECPAKVREDSYGAEFDEDCKNCPFCITYDEEKGSHWILGYFQCSADHMMTAERVGDFVKWEKRENIRYANHQMDFDGKTPVD